MVENMQKANGRVSSVAVDAFWLDDGGIGRMANEIIQRADPGIGIEKVRCAGAKLSPLSPITLARGIAKASSDIVWSPGFIPPAWGFPNKKVAITIHDLGHIDQYSSAHTFYYNYIMRPLLKNVDLIFTVSEFSRTELIKWAPNYPQDRIVSIYNGVSDAFTLEGPVSEPGYPYVIYVGNRRLHKNLERAIHAFAQSGLPGKGYKFLLTGQPDDQLAGWIAAAGVRDSIEFVGSVTDEHLASLYRGARALIFVSLYEGFGLPLVEAMACGCPSVTANTTALNEVGGDAAVKVDPESIAAIAAGMDQLCLNDDVHRACVDHGLVRAKGFRWEDTAEAYWKHLLA